MIVVRIEMWPRGAERRKRPLGEIFIANIGGTAESGNYDVRLMKSAEYAKRPGIWRRAQVLGFPRLRLGQYDLLMRALAACLGARNPADAPAAVFGELGSPPVPGEPGDAP